MKTTSIVIEILIIGFQTLIWCILVVLSMFGYWWVNLNPDLLLGFTLFITAMSYTFGVLFDNLWNRISEPMDKHIRSLYFKDTKEVHSMRGSIFAENKQTVEFMEYIRSRMRIARSSVYNFPLITVAALVFITVQFQVVAPELRMKIIIFVLVSGALLTLLAVSAYRKLTHTYYKQILVLYKELGNKK